MFKAVIAASYERIHRSNLVGMGVLPLQFAGGETWQSLGLTGEELFDIDINDQLQPRSEIKVVASSSDGTSKEFTATVRIDTPVEMDYFRNGGIPADRYSKVAKRRVGSALPAYH